MPTTDAAAIPASNLLDRLPVPRGALPIWGGLAVNGAASYVFLGLAARRLDQSGYDAISILWATTFILGPGLFLPLEQELARALTARRVAGRPGGAVVNRAMVLAAGLMAVLAVVGSIAFVAGADRELFGDHAELAWVLLVSVGAYGMLFLVRGVLAGSESFGRYAIAVGGEGGFRLVVTALVLAALTPSAAVLGLAFVAGPLVAAVAAGAAHPTFGSGGDAGSWRELGDDLGSLLVASLALTFVFNIGPVAYQLLDRGPGDLAPGALFSARIVAGVPLFLFQAVQSSILPQLTRLAATGDVVGFRTTVRRTAAAVVAAGAVAVGGAAVLGPWVIRTAFDQRVGWSDITLLTASTVVFIVASLVGVSLVALNGHRAVMLAWLAGAATLGLALLVPVGPALRVEAALLVGSAAALAGMLAVLRSRLREPG